MAVGRVCVERPETLALRVVKPVHVRSRYVNVNATIGVVVGQRTGVIIHLGQVFRDFVFRKRFQSTSVRAHGIEAVRGKKVHRVVAVLAPGVGPDDSHFVRHPPPRGNQWIALLHPRLVGCESQQERILVRNQGHYGATNCPAIGQLKQCWPEDIGHIRAEDSVRVVADSCARDGIGAERQYAVLVANL